MAGVEVAVLGDVNVDVLIAIPAYPPPGGDALTEHITIQAGGSAANTAIALAKLGVTAKLIARAGDDVWAELGLRALAEAGVDLGAVQSDDQASTGMFFIPVTPDGERTMFGHRGANARTDPVAIGPDALGRARILHVSGYAFLEAPQREAAWRAVGLAKQNGVAISLDTGLQPALRLAGEMRRLLPHLAVCVLGLDEAQALVGGDSPAGAAAALIERGVQTVGLKLGARGCLLADASRVVHLPSFEVATVDTTGAGDAFSAGLLFGRLRGLSLPASGILATALGGLATTAWGGGSALPGRAEVTRLLRDHLRAGQSHDRAAWIAEVLTAIES
ncbi:MAG: carbohydrate kinase family protein [Burkholderiales bacterium]